MCTRDHRERLEAVFANLVLCIEGSALALALSAPSTAILLVAVVGTATPEEIALVVLSVVVGLLVGAAVKEGMARRDAPAAPAGGATAAAPPATA